MYDREKIKDVEINYCGFTIEELVEDHKGLKEQIKDRERCMDEYGRILSKEDLTSEELNMIIDNLENLSHEMMSVNL